MIKAASVEDLIEAHALTDVRACDLQRVYSWAEKHEHSDATTCDAKLANAYLAACTAVALADELEEQVGCGWSSLNGLAYMHRDILGKTILLRMRKRPPVDAAFCEVCEACKARGLKEAA